MATVYVLPAALALAGPGVLVAATGGSFLPIAVIWWITAAIVGSIGRRGRRMLVTAALIPVCVITVFEGGAFMLPALITLLVIDAIKPSARSSLPQGPPH